MANTTTAANPIVWEAGIEKNRYGGSVAMAICNTDARGMMDKGEKLQRPNLANKPTFPAYTGGTVTFTDFTLEDDYITIDQEFADGYKFTKKQLIQSGASLVSEASQELADGINEKYDTVVLAQIAADADAGNNVTLGAAVDAATTAQVETAIRKAKTKLQESKGNLRKGLYLAGLPEFMSHLEDSFSTKGFVSADKIMNDGFSNYLGFVGRYKGIACFVSNELPANTALMGIVGGTDLIFQSKDYVKVADSTDGFDTNVMVHALFGVDTRIKNKNTIVEIATTA